MDESEAIVVKDWGDGSGSGLGSAWKLVGWASLLRGGWGTGVFGGSGELEGCGLGDGWGDKLGSGNGSGSSEDDSWIDGSGDGEGCK
jgi:hypothetical protein